MNEEDKKTFSTIVDHASPYITLSYVLDDKGNMLAHFNFHPQMDEITVALDIMTTNTKEIQLTSDDVRAFADTLHEFADAADVVVEKYHKRHKNAKVIL